LTNEEAAVFTAPSPLFTPSVTSCRQVPWLWPLATIRTTDVLACPVRMRARAQGPQDHGDPEQLLAELNQAEAETGNPRLALV
ncbi:MAG: hypothetical protein LC637_14390, partial [Xanthomonadaceae bacterium]|nr:hypothetical protein [Xanthomonadaceae bacterium]